jgi:hypothetical protein
VANQLITRENFGAWVLQVDLKTWDLPAWMADGNDALEAWTVTDDDRGQLMEFGDKVIFWVSGDSQVMASGIWGLGYITGEAHDALPFEPDDDLGFWLNREAAVAARNEVPVDVPLLEVPVTDQDLRREGIDDLEIQAMPPDLNPSWVSIEQLARIEELLLGWPEIPDSTEDITVTARGAGSGDAYTNKVVEDAAIEAVADVYSNEGWNIEDVSMDEVGWDLTATSDAGDELKIEVKGVSGDRPQVFLTASELAAARTQSDWILVVVTRAISKPETWEFTAQDAIAAAEPYVFKADLTPQA